jgi:nucleoside-diphosphate-sugar epimerase
VPLIALNNPELYSQTLPKINMNRRFGEKLLINFGKVNHTCQYSPFIPCLDKRYLELTTVFRQTSLVPIYGCFYARVCSDGGFMRILVTGGAGYLGSILCERLLQKGYQVTAVDSLLYGEASLFHLCHDPNFDFVRGDVRNESMMKDLIAQSDAIIPLAAIVGAPACDRDPLMATSINLDAIVMLNRLRTKDQLVVYPVTNSGYGTQSGDVYCTEETPLEPISLYGQDKVRAEAELLSSENAITFRLATVFGLSPRLRLDLLVNHFTYTAVTDGYLVVFEKDFKRNFIHVRDVAECFIYGLENPNDMVGKPFNAGLDSANVSKEELATKIQEQVPNFFVHYSEIGTDPDKRNYIVSNQRLREAGFEATRSLDEGIRELIMGYKMLGRGQFKNV